MSSPTPLEVQDRIINSIRIASTETQTYAEVPAKLGRFASHRSTMNMDHLAKRKMLRIDEDGSNGLTTKRYGPSILACIVQSRFGRRCSNLNTNISIVKRIHMSLAYLTLILFLTPTPTLAGSTGDFDLYNYTPYTIVVIAISTPNDNRWFPLSGDQIEPGDSDHISFKPGLPCEQQLLVRLSNGQTLTWDNGFNLCSTSRIIISPDPDGGYTAHYR